MQSCRTALVAALLALTAACSADSPTAAEQQPPATEEGALLEMVPAAASSTNGGGGAGVNAPVIENLHTEEAGPFSTTRLGCYGRFTVCIRFGFRDADGSADAPWRTEIDWGDGTPWTPNTLAREYTSLLAGHNYTQAGTYTARVRVTDAAGMASEQTTVIVVGGPAATTGSITGTVINALNGQTVPGAQVQLYTGTISPGTAVGTTTTGQTGGFTFTSLAAGTYAIRVTVTGFIVVDVNGIVVGSGPVTLPNVVTSPTLGTGQTRIVLSWGETPADLDSYLTGPTDGGRFLIAYFDEGNLTESPFAALDLDDVTSFGPETITIGQQRDGVYRYSVNDYTNRSSLTSTALSTSGARVQVFRGDALRAEFTVPSGPGTVWTVFDLEGDTIRPINSMGFGEVPLFTRATAPGVLTSRASTAPSWPAKVGVGSR